MRSANVYQRLSSLNQNRAPCHQLWHSRLPRRGAATVVLWNGMAEWNNPIGLNQFPPRRKVTRKLLCSLRAVRTVQTQAPPGLAAVRTQSRKLQGADGDEILVGIKLAGLGERLQISLSQVDFRKRSRKTVHAHRQEYVGPRTVSCSIPARRCDVAQRSGQ